MDDYIQRTDGKVTLAWTREDLKNKIVVIEGRRFGSCLPWQILAEVSVPEARLIWVRDGWRDEPLLFDLVTEICAACAARVAA